MADDPSILHNSAILGFVLINRHAMVLCRYLLLIGFERFDECLAHIAAIQQDVLETIQ